MRSITHYSFCDDLYHSSCAGQGDRKKRIQKKRSKEIEEGNEKRHPYAGASRAGKQYGNRFSGTGLKRFEKVPDVIGDVVVHKKPDQSEGCQCEQRKIEKKKPALSCRMNKRYMQTRSLLR